MVKSTYMLTVSSEFHKFIENEIIGFWVDFQSNLSENVGGVTDCFFYGRTGVMII